MSVFLKTICDNTYSVPLYTGNFGACADQGEAAGSQGVPRERNPYPKGTGEWDSWDYGWTHSYA